MLSVAVALFILHQFVLGAIGFGWLIRFCAVRSAQHREFDMRRQTRFFTILSMVLAILAVHASASASPDFRSIARLFGPTPLRGKAVYEERDHGGTLEQRFKVELQNGIPGKQYTVRVNGDNVGSITINNLGRGKLQLRTAQFIDDPSDGLPIPNGFPRLDTGAIVTAGPLAGVVFDTLDTNLQRYRVEGEFGNDGGVKYQERFDDGLLEREFEVEIEHQQPNRIFAVMVRGRIVGSIHTNSLGRGRLELRTPAFINDPSDGQPLPNTFPSLRAGEVVTVGNMTATLAAVP
jgi:hypothetical protein